MKSGIPLALSACLLVPPCAMAQNPVFPEVGPLPAIVEQVGDEMWVTPEARTHYYFGWEHSPNLRSRWRMADMALGSPSPTFHFQVDPLVPRDFFRVRAIDKWSPGDVDGDGIDDLYELLNGLNPLDAADASEPSAANPLLTNLEYYRNRFGLYEADGSPPRREYFSEEVSMVLWPSALSSEVSVFLNEVPSPTVAEAISSEISVFLTDVASPTVTEVISAEVSVFKASAPLDLGAEAVSVEVSVFKATAPLDFGAESVSAEVSVLRNP